MTFIAQGNIKTIFTSLGHRSGKTAAMEKLRAERLKKVQEGGDKVKWELATVQDYLRPTVHIK